MHYIDELFVKYANSYCSSMIKFIRIFAARGRRSASTGQARAAPAKIYMAGQLHPYRGKGIHGGCSDRRGRDRGRAGLVEAVVAAICG